MDFPKWLSAPLVIPLREYSLSAHFRFRLSKVGLEFKLLVIVVAVSLVGVLSSFVLVLTLQRQQLIDATHASVTRLSNAVEASLEHAMLNNDRVLLSQIVQTMANREGAIEQIRIVNVAGVVQVSSTASEVESRFDRTEPACQFCHYDQTNSGNQTTILTSNVNHPVLLNVQVIRNRLECQSCHSAQSPVLGIMMIEIPLADLDNQLTAAIWRIGLSALITIGLLVGLMLIALKRLIVQPVHELTQGMTEIRNGNLDYVVQVPSHDELGDLAAASDAMRQQLKASFAERDRRNQDLVMLNDLAVNASESLDLQQILELALDTVVNRLGMQAGSIYLADEDTGCFTLRACRGLSKAQQRDIENRRQQPEGDLSHKTAQSGEEVVVANMASDPRFLGLWDDLDNRSYVNIPLKGKGRAIGTMGLVTHPGQPLTDVGVNVLKTVGHEVGTAIDNAFLLAETRRREQETITLYRLMMKIASSLEFDHVVAAISEGACQVLNADVGAVGLVDEEQGKVSIKAVVGNRTDIWKVLHIPLCNSFFSVTPICIAEWSSDLAIPRVAELIAQEGIVSSLAAPMWRNGHLYGFVGILTRQPRHFRNQDTQLFVRFILQVVVAIENADLYKQVRYMATLEERDRLARELHDNLAQMLGYLNIKAAITKHFLANNEIEGAFASLLELEQVSNQAYVDVREAIFSLRTISPSGWELVPTLREYLADYRKHYGIDAQLVLADESCCGLNTEVQVQVNRIIQEALTNVRKHSGANRAWVRFESSEHHVRISIEDDGCGFDPENSSREGSEHFGLQIMRERAASVGGTLQIDSSNHAGTRIVLQMPLL